MMNIILAIQFFIIYFLICILFEKLYNLLCVDFLDYVVETGNEKEQKWISKIL